MAATDTYTEFESESEHNRRLLGKEGLVIEITEQLANQIDPNNWEHDIAILLRKINHTDGTEVGDLMSKRELMNARAGGNCLTLRSLWVIADAIGCEVKVEVVKRK